MLLNVNVCPGTKFAATSACATASVAGSSSSASVSKPAPPSKWSVSAPLPPSSCAWVVKNRSSPAPPNSASLPSPSIRASLPFPPFSVSSPALKHRLLLSDRPGLPVGPDGGRELPSPPQAGCVRPHYPATRPDARRRAGDSSRSLLCCFAQLERAVTFSGLVLLAFQPAAVHRHVTIAPYWLRSLLACDWRRPSCA